MNAEHVTREPQSLKIRGSGDEGYVDVIGRDKSERFDLETPFVWTDSWFQDLRVSRDVCLSGFPHFIPSLHGQGACERKGDCNKKWLLSVQVKG